MTVSSNGAHVLVFPYPAPGHMMPLLDLAHKLSLRGVTITVLVTPKNLPILRPLLSAAHPSAASITPLVFPFPAHPSLPSGGAENTKDLPPAAFPAIMHAMRQLHAPILQWFRAHPWPPVAIISDMFLWWTHQLATELGVPRFMFSPSGVMAMSIIYSLRRYPPERHHDEEDPNALVTLSRIPNSQVYPWWQLMFLCSSSSSSSSTSYVEEGLGDPISDFMRDGVLANMASWGMVFNSFSELERVYLEHVIAEAGHHRVWAVGPLLPSEINNNNNNNPSPSGPIMRRSLDDDDDDDIIVLISSWLDTCGDGTVVYVCFGSQAVLGNTQMERIAAGLEKSGARFVWCSKEQPPQQVSAGGGGDYGVIPSGFEDRTAGRGLVVRGWAPQVAILRHRAVGAFLTHCGWNSVLEGLMAGVTMLAWPMEGEQFLNATLLVDELKVAIRVCEGAQTVPDSNKLARVVAGSVHNKLWSDNIIRSRELMMKAMEAVGEGGSSYMDLDKLAAHLSNRAFS